jgi:inorganic pyrophosphatase
MTDLTLIDPMFDPAQKSCRVVVETPRGSRSKYTYDPGIEAFELSGILPAGMSFPLDFGFIPATKGGDDDPLDVLLIGEEPVAVGSIVHARILGVIEAEQTERDGRTVRNDRLIARADLSISYQHASSSADLEPRFIEHIGQFFVNYNALKGKRFRVLGDGGPDRAMRLILEAALEEQR